jgi:hypothetical protein
MEQTMERDDIVSFEQYERIVRYVRGELPRAEADAFEEAYFQDEKLARLVEMEQILQGRGAEAPAETSAAPAAIARAPASPGYRTHALAAAILVLVAAGVMMIWMREHVPAGSDAGVVGRLGGPVATANVLRLSPVRDGAGEAPAFAVNRPPAGESVTLMLPLPPEVGDDAALGVRLLREGSTGRVAVWNETIGRGAGASPWVLLTLPHETLEPDDYSVELRAGADDDSARFAEFRFRVKTD